MLSVHKQTVGSFMENCYAVVNERGRALIIDPGAEADRLIAWIEGHHWQVEAILLTHAHLDHIGALEELREHFQVDVYLHEVEADFLTDPMLNLSQPLGSPLVTRPAEHYWTTMGKKQVGSFEFDVEWVPGHTPGHVIYIFQEGQFALVGDTLFKESIGRTDFVYGDQAKLLQGIKDKILTLDSTYNIYPGHGPKTQVSHEVRHNPFV